MQPTSQGWKVFDAAIPVLTCSYSFGPAPANALAVGADGGLFVVSPPYHATEGAFEQLRQYGAVSGSAPGLRFNNIAPLFMVRDRRALRRWLAAEYEKAPPRWILAAHGDIADLHVNAEGARKLFARA